MKLHILFVIAACLSAMNGCGKADPDYSAFYRDPEEIDPMYTDNPGLENNQIKAMSFNIRYYGAATDTGTKAWEVRRDAFTPMVTEQRPTVIGMQEARPPQLTWIAGQWTEYEYIGKGRRDNNSQTDEFVPIFYRKTAVKLIRWGYFWLSETPGVSSVSWGSTVPRIAMWAVFKHYASGREFFFVNTHIDTGSGSDLAAINQMRVLQEQMALLNTDNLPTVVTADFNAQIGSTVMAGIQLSMTNVRAQSPVTDNKSTYQAFGANGLIVDHIFCSEFTPLRHETIDKVYEQVPYISDHYPITGILQFK